MCSAVVNDISMHNQTGLDQYLTFMLGDEEYGVNILRVPEIRGWEVPTNIPNTPDFILGVINLRGMLVPIIISSKLVKGLATVDEKKIILLDIDLFWILNYILH